MSYTIINDNNITHLKTLEDNTIDSIITDPPYGIEFLGKDWDTNTGAVETWRQCLRVLKPGGHLLAFSSARTYHQLATNIQEVGFEIRDQLMWLYASGFPKAQDIGKAIDRRGNNGQQWAGWKTALKPSHEPIVMARKPFKGSTMDNVLTHGTGALNIDASRIPFEGVDTRSGGANGWSRVEFGEKEPAKYKDQMATAKSKIIKKPTKSKLYKDNTMMQGMPETHYIVNERGRFPSNVIGEVAEHYQKYFYCPKVSRRERHCGFEKTSLPDRLCGPGGEDWVTSSHPMNWTEKDPLAHIPTDSPTNNGNYMGTTTHPTKHKSVGNNHPTVKPVALMRYLIQLVTPANSTVLDPFCGSGSTGMAAVELGHTFTGIELDADYVEIAKRRIEGWNRPKETGNTYNELFEENK